MWTAFRAWLRTSEGALADAADRPGQPYLHNRLHSAFMAGFEAGQAHEAHAKDKERVN